ncbi:MAG TPA: PEGA domain-containing protein [Vicinamibacterales bacterium]|nr:PEGA domain-containing protein [Vicinamibacterales bacterium]
MSAPYIDLPSSISSTGHEDGLGRRALSFDRETGAMLEQLVVRPEIAVYERLIRERIDQLTAFEDERFARPSSVTRNADTGELTVVSAFVPGHRISDLLETSHEAGVVPGVDVALGYLLDALPALSALHGTAGFAHGLIDPARSVLTSAGRVVLLDAAYGAAVQRLGLSRKRLWATFGIAAPNAAVNTLDAALDVSQTALSALMLVLGRTLLEDEYPEAIPSLLMEAVDVAQIRGSTGFAGGLQRILQRSLPLPGRRAYTTADEMVVDVRQLVRREIGVEVCRRALRDFVEQMNAAIAASSTADAEPDSSGTAGEEDLTASILEEPTDDGGELSAAPIETESETLSDPLEFEIRLESDDTEAAFDLPSLHFGDSLSGSHAATASGDAGESTLAPSTDVDRFNDQAIAVTGSGATDSYARDEISERTTVETDAPVHGDPEPSHRHSSFEPPSEPREHQWRASDNLESAAESRGYTRTDHDSTTQAPQGQPFESVADYTPEPEPLREAFDHQIRETTYPRQEATLDPAPAGTETHRFQEPSGAPVTAEAATIEPEPAPEPIEDFSAESVDEAATETSTEAVEAASAEPIPELDTEHKADESNEQGSKNSRRKRQQQQKSARARKDKLRSTAVSQPTVSQPAASQPAVAAAKPPSKSGWLVPPDRAAAFEQHAQAPPVQPAPMMTPPPPAPSFAQPSFAAPPAPVYSPPAPSHHQPQPPPMPGHQSPRHTNVPPGRPAVTIAPVASSPVVKLKTEPPSGYEPQRPRRAPQPQSGVPLEPVTPLPSAMRGPMFETEEPRGFPWKLAIAVLAVVAIGIVGGRAYLASHAAKDPTAETTASAVPITPEPEPAPVAPPPKNSGQIVVQTQPAGAKVLLDGKAAGESPVTLNVAPGRHLVTMISSAGSVKQTVRVGAGKSVTIDQPVFSGWLAVFASIVLDVAEKGTSIGSTEQNRLLLAPGHHSLTLSNKDLGYTAVQEVDINAAEVTSITINPVGAVNFNAVPWGEVWIDGHKIGETPIANMMLPLGVREFVFKNSQFGERRVTATIRADKPTAVSVDFNKPPEQ